MRVVTGLITLLLFAGVASANAATRAEKAIESELRSLREVSGYVWVLETLPEHPLHDESGGYADLSQELEGLKQTCIRDYSAAFASESARITRDAEHQGSLDGAIAGLFGVLRRLQDGADECAKPLKVQFHAGVVLEDNRQIALIDWFSELQRVSFALAAEVERADLRQQRRAAFWEAFASGLAAMRPVDPQRLVMVRPYLRSDGTLVQSHLRTLPNSTCADNLSGCR
jgi:hypothetical protein